MLRWLVLLMGAAAAVLLSAWDAGDLPVIRALQLSLLAALCVVFFFLGEREGRGNRPVTDLGRTHGLSRSDALKFLRAYRQVFAAEARCLIWYADVTGQPGWNLPPEGDEPPFNWHVHPLDREAAECILGPGYPQEEFGERWRQARVAEDDLAYNRRFHEALLHKESRLAQTYRVTDHDGVQHWYIEDLRITPTGAARWHCTGVCLDITERKMAELDMQGIMRQAGCIIFHGAVVTGNDPSDVSQMRWSMRVADEHAAQRVLPLEVLPGENYLDKFLQSRLPEDLAAGDAAIHEALASGTLRYTHTFRCRDRHGQLHWISEDARMNRMGPHRYRVVTVCINVTGQKATEEALEQARTAAEAANAAKSTFLANMSHEIRTPMTAIVGYADLLADPELGAADRAAYIQVIRRNSDHLLEVLNDILDLSRIETGKLSVESMPCKPQELVEGVVNLMRPRAGEKNVQMQVQVDASAPGQILSDPLRLRQIVMNLVSNAVKFTENGRVVVRLAGESEGEGPMLRIEVSDTGIGIAPDQIPLLFQPFHQADPSSSRRFGGTGLGLVISRKLAQLLGGTITVTSRPGEGSTFVARVAAVPVPSRSAATAHAAAVNTVRLDGLRVLVADDGRDGRRLVTIHLRRLGCAVVSVDDGQQAIEMAMKAVREGSPFDAILMDMQMPVLDGYSATRALRSSGYAYPIIALTAHAMEGDRQRCLAAGCNDYVIKPIDIGQLSRAIHQAVRACEVG